MKYLFLIVFLVSFISSVNVHAQENKGLNLSGFFKIKKAEEKDKYLPVEKKKKDAVMIKGKAGPAMPAVPAGSIKKEIIVKSTLLPPELTLEKENKKPSLPPVTVNYNPKIPFTTLIFQNGLQQNLETAHLEILKDSLNNIKKGFYRGKIQIKSFSDSGQKRALDRAQKVRTYLLDNGISLIDLDMQAFPTSTQGNTVHIFLLGES